MQQDRRNERAANDIGTLDVEVIGIAGHKLGLRAQCLDVVQHIAALVEADNRTHPHVILLGVSDHDLSSRFAQRVDHGLDVRDWCQDPADRRAFLPGLDRHFLGDFLMNRSNSGVPGPESGARIAALSESRSATKRTASRAITGCRCSFSDVSAELVNETTS
jgi:hypothetical protein